MAQSFLTSLLYFCTLMVTNGLKNFQSGINSNSLHALKQSLYQREHSVNYGQLPRSICPVNLDLNVSWEGINATHPDIAPLIQEIDMYFTKELVEEQWPGAIATIVFNNQQIWTKGYGKRNFSDPKSGPPTGESLFRIASNTKVFTDILLYKLEEMGIVSLDDPLLKYMPKFSLVGGDTNVTLRQLASHTAGIPRDSPYPCDIYSPCNESEILDLLSLERFIWQPSSRFHYSNLGFALLGRALEHAANNYFKEQAKFKGLHARPERSYEELLHDLVLEPMGMGATFNPIGSDMGRLCVGGNDDNTAVPFNQTTWASPAGGLLASANDMAKLTMNTLLTSMHPALTAESVRASLLSAISLEDGIEAIGNPWEMEHYNISGMSYWMKGKGGALPGFRSSVMMIPTLKIGVFICVFKSSVPEPSVYTQPTMATLAPAVHKILSSRQPDAQARLPKKAQSLLGTYYLNVTVKEQDSVLLVDFLGGTFRLESQDDAFEKAKSLNLIQTTPLGERYYLYPTRVSYYPPPQLQCLYANGGSQDEFMYFIFEEGEKMAVGLRFMGSQLMRISNSTDSNENT
eukprot:m.219539 g.219539  ORF g.219539 m.219539 type:complete len:573 (+) comp15915_c0_seq6:117-1835(+)